jgi:hypothetical protein
MELSQNGTQYGEATEYGGRYYGVAADADIEGTLNEKLYSATILINECMYAVCLCKSKHTIASFIKAVLRVAMRREYGDLVTTILQAYGCVDDQTLCSADSEIWMEENNILLLFRLFGRHRRVRLASDHFPRGILGERNAFSPKIFVNLSALSGIHHEVILLAFAFRAVTFPIYLANARKTLQTSAT